MTALEAFPFPNHPFTREDALNLGITDQHLRSATELGGLRRPFRGVYVPAQLPDSTEIRTAAIASVVPEHAVVCDRTAAYIHGIDVFAYGDHDLVMPIELCSLRGKSITKRPGVDGRTRDLVDRDVTLIGGVAVTTPLRTALDLACGLTRLRAIAALDEFRRRFGIPVSDLRLEVLRFRRRRGVIQARRLIELSDPRAESPRESWTRLSIIDAGLAVPEPQFWVDLGGGRCYRLDLAYPHLRVAIEYDGAEFHRRTERQRERDEERRQHLRDHGWIVIVVDLDNFFTPDGSGWLAELRDALRTRSRRLRWARD